MKKSLLGLALAALLFATAARADDQVVVGKAGTDMLYAAIDVGIAHGFYKKYGVDVKAVQLASAAAAVTGVTGGTIDINLGSGTTMGFTVKGVPQMAVATMSGPPYDFVLAVDPKGPIKTVDDLKGKSISVTSVGAITWWFVRQLGILKGWGADGIIAQPIGGGPAPQFAAMARGDVQGIVSTPELAADYAERGQAKVLLQWGDVIKTFQTHTIFASNKLIAEKPEVLRGFLKGWFESVRYMVDPAHHAECVEIAAKSVGISLSAGESVYSTEMKGMSLDGHFDPAAVDVVRKSLPESGILDTVPEAKVLYTDKFVPVKLD